jgi:hypothetical protein
MTLGRCSPCTTSTALHTLFFQHPRVPLASVLSRSGRIQKNAFAKHSCSFVFAGFFCARGGARILHPLTWPTQPFRLPASPQRIGRRVDLNLGLELGQVITYLIAKSQTYNKHDKDMTNKEAVCIASGECFSRFRNRAGNWSVPGPEKNHHPRPTKSL